MQLCDLDLNIGAITTIQLQCSCNHDLLLPNEFICVTTKNLILNVFCIRNQENSASEYILYATTYLST